MHYDTPKVIINFFLQLSCLHSSEDTVGRIIHQKEVRLAHVSLVIVLVFISCHSVKWIPNIYELRMAEMDKVWDKQYTLLDHRKSLF